MAPLPSTWCPLLTILVSIFSVTLASYAMQPATIHPNHPNTCYIKDSKSFYDDGDSWQVSGCGLASCTKIVGPTGKSRMMISYEGCIAVGYEPPCYLVDDKEAEFPDCCPQVQCPDSREAADESMKNSYNSMEDVKNELEDEDETVKNGTAVRNTLLGDKNYYETPQDKERQWRNVNNDRVGHELQDSEPVSNSHFHNNHVEQDEDDEQHEQKDFPHSRKVSPKMWYWF